MNEVLTASAGQEDDVDPDRAARGEPVRFKDGVPVYVSGQAPAFLRTKAQLSRVRRKPHPDQRPVAYVYAHWYGTRIALWAGAVAEDAAAVGSAAPADAAAAHLHRLQRGALSRCWVGRA